jgi:hypothetical protein
MYTFVDFTSQIAGRRGVPCPTNKGVSYTNLVCWLGRDLKNRLLLLLLCKIGYPPIVNMSHGQIVLFTKIGYLHKYYNDN